MNTVRKYELQMRGSHENGSFTDFPLYIIVALMASTEELFRLCFGVWVMVLLVGFVAFIAGDVTCFAFMVMAGAIWLYFKTGSWARALAGTNWSGTVRSGYAFLALAVLCAYVAVGSIVCPGINRACAVVLPTAMAILACCIYLAGRDAWSVSRARGLLFKLRLFERAWLYVALPLVCYFSYLMYFDKVRTLVDFMLDYQIICLLMFGAMFWMPLSIAWECLDLEAIIHARTGGWIPHSGRIGHSSRSQMPALPGRYGENLIRYLRSDLNKMPRSRAQGPWHKDAAEEVE